MVRNNENTIWCARNQFLYLFSTVEAIFSKKQYLQNLSFINNIRCVLQDKMHVRHKRTGTDVQANW